MKLKIILSVISSSLIILGCSAVMTMHKVDKEGLAKAAANEFIIKEFTVEAYSVGNTRVIRNKNAEETAIKNYPLQEISALLSAQYGIRINTDFASLNYKCEEKIMTMAGFMCETQKESPNVITIKYAYEAGGYQGLNLYYRLYVISNGEKLVWHGDKINQQALPSQWAMVIEGVKFITNAMKRDFEKPASEFSSEIEQKSGMESSLIKKGFVPDKKE